MFYTYDENGFYSGTSDVEVERSTKWKPDTPPPGYQSYFDGYGWHTVQNYQDKIWTLEEAKSIALGYVNRRIFISDPSGKYTEYEKDTFDSQYAEAKAYQDGGAAGPYINAISDATGESVEAVVQKVLAKREEYDARLSVFAAELQVLRNKITKAKRKMDLPASSDLIRQSV